MPGYVTDMREPGRRPYARATLRTPGEWQDLDQELKDAWNKATAAIRELFELVEAKR